MCGIAGYISFQEPLAPIQENAFHASLRFRGPDHQGESVLNGTNFAGKFFHYRLSIIDLDARSNQPMKSGSGRYEITFNGEIYNYRELRNELVSAGFTFKTSSDTEVILTAFEHYGVEQAIPKLDGMFAFALADKTARKIYLARDAFGKKPLYFYYQNGHVVFSSDIRSFEYAGVGLSLNEEALAYYFCELSTPEKLSIYKEVAKVPPGSFLAIDATSFKTVTWFQADFSKKLNLPRQEIVEECERLLERAVQKRMISDVGVSAFLSGGIDSSLIVALMAKNSSKPIRTYTVGYQNKDFDESVYAKKVAEKWKTDHSEIFLDDMSIPDMEFVLEECGEPFADASIFPSFAICKAISANEKVALSGDGGDELFGGYYEYYFASRLDKYASKKPLIKGLAFLNKLGIKTTKTIFSQELLQYGFNIPEHLLLHRRNMGFSPGELRLLLPGNSDFAEQELKRIWQENSGKASSILGRVMSGSYHTRLVNDYLVKIDRASMMNSLEVRSPFLDRDLVRFVAQIPDEQLIYNGIPKSITKEIAKKYLPTEDIHRTKMGFGVPIGEWFKGQLLNDLKNTLENGSSKIRKDYAEKTLKDHLKGHNNTDKLVTLWAFHRWNKGRF